MFSTNLMNGVKLLFNNLLVPVFNSKYSRLLESMGPYLFVYRCCYCSCCSGVSGWGEAFCCCQSASRRLVRADPGYRI